MKFSFAQPGDLRLRHPVSKAAGDWVVLIRRADFVARRRERMQAGDK